MANQNSTAPADGTRAYPIAEGFERLHISKVPGYKLINDGKLQTFFIGSRRYVTEAALRAFVEAQTSATAATEGSVARAARVVQLEAGRKRKRNEKKKA